MRCHLWHRLKFEGVKANDSGWSSDTVSDDGAYSQAGGSLLSRDRGDSRAPSGRRAVPAAGSMELSLRERMIALERERRNGEARLVWLC